MKLIIVAIILGTMQVTSYRSVPAQTDKSPWITSIGARVHPHGCAVSRDLLKSGGGPLNYGDWIYVEGYGLKVVNDCMGPKAKQAIDLWVATKAEEHRINVKHRRVFLIKIKEDICQRPIQE